jgi:hypothetical protein
LEDRNFPYDIETKRIDDQPGSAGERRFEL